MAYATVTDLTNRHDERILKDLVSDSGTPETDLSINAIILALLEDGASIINSSCQVGKQYTQADLASLSGTDANLLVMINCEITMGLALKRRQEKYKEYAKLVHEQSELWLKQLRQGHRVFDIEVNLNASLPAVDGLTAQEHRTRNWLPERVKGYYTTGDRYAIGRN